LIFKKGSVSTGCSSPMPELRRDGPHLAAPVVLERLLDLLHGVHHERPVASDRFAEGLTTDHEHAEPRAARLRFEGDGVAVVREENGVVFFRRALARAERA